MPQTGRHGRVDFAYESTWASYTAPTHRLMIESEGLEHQLNNIEDNSLTGDIYTKDKILAGINETGSLDGNAYGDTIGILLWGVLGNEAAVSDPADAYVIASYTGSDQYARLTLSDDTLTAETSNDRLSWTTDSNFGSSGTLDISGVGADTATELASSIDGYTGWSAKFVGNSASDSDNIADFAATEVKNDEDHVGCKIMPYQIAASTAAKTHTITPAGSTESLPSFSITVGRTLGTDESLGFVGCKFASLAISTSASDLIKISITVDGKNRETGKTDASVALSNVRAFTAANCKLFMVRSGGTIVEFNETKEISVTFNTNVDDNRVIGSLYKQEQTRQNSTMDISFSCNNTSTQYAFDTDYTAGTPVELILYFESATDCDTDNNIPYNVLFRFPRCIIDNFNSPVNTPDRLVITGAMTVTKPTNTTYTNHVYAYVVDNDTTLYSS